MPSQGGEPCQFTRDSRRVRGISWTADSSAVVASLEHENTTRSLWKVSLHKSPIARILGSYFGAGFPGIARTSSSLAYVIHLADSNLWGTDLRKGRTAAALTSDPQPDVGPKISPDGTRVVWRSSRNGSEELWIASVDGSNRKRLCQTPASILGEGAWAPDEGESPVALSTGCENVETPSYSRDGRFIYFSTDKSGSWELMKMNVTGSTATKLFVGEAYAAVEVFVGKWIFIHV